ncbi:MAG: restriction endonuclease subunit S [Lysobacterales bacterium]
MSGWKAMPLSDFAESVDYGVTASATDQPVGPKFLRITDIQDGAVNWDMVPWCECDTRSATDARLKAGDIVFARTGATTGKSFLVAECPIDAVFASYLIRVRLRDCAEPRFVSYFFQTPDYWAQIAKSARGVAQPGVNATTLKALKIPLPPLPEQRRIAEILDKADALRAKRRAALAQLDTLTQSIFLDMFGDPATNPKGWPVAALKNCVAKIQIGPFGSLLHQEDYIGGGIPLVNPKHIQRGVIEIGGDETVTPEKYKELRVYHLAPGDVVMGRRGEMGRCAIVDAASCPLLCGTGSLFLRPDKTQTTSVFLRAMLSSEAIKSRLERLSLGQTLPNLNSRIVEGLEIPLPPVTVQRAFADRVTANKALGTLQQNSLTWLDALFTSLQHRAFRGEL